MSQIRGSLAALEVWLVIQVILSILLSFSLFRRYSYWIFLYVVIALIFPLILYSFAKAVTNFLSSLKFKENPNKSSFDNIEDSIIRRR